MHMRFVKELLPLSFLISNDCSSNLETDHRLQLAPTRPSAASKEFSAAARLRQSELSTRVLSYSIEANPGSSPLQPFVASMHFIGPAYAIRLASDAIDTSSTRKSVREKPIRFPSPLQLEAVCLFRHVAQFEDSTPAKRILEAVSRSHGALS